MPGKDRCRWHPKDDADRKRHRAESRKGGLAKAYNQLPKVPAIAEIVDIDKLDLESAAGSRTLLAGALRQLAHLPLDVRTANAIAQVCTAQRSVIETSDFEARLAALEAAQVPALRRA